MAETKTKETQVIEAVVTAKDAELATTEQASVVAWEPPRWTDERIALAKKHVAPPTATDAEFEYFIAWSKRTGLDPFIQQSYLVERKQSVNGNWVTVHKPMAAEAGMAARADVMPDYRGMAGATVYKGDVFEVKTQADGSQVVKHEWSLEKREAGGNALVGAWAHIKRAGRIVHPTFLTFESRCPRDRDGKVSSPFWRGEKGPEQLLKCARAAQYRLGFPNVFAGVYIEGEVEDLGAEAERLEREEAAPAGSSATDSLAAKVRARVAAAAAKGQAPANSNTPVQPPDVLTFGEKKGLPKGKRIAELTSDELREAIDLGDASVKESPTASWVPVVSACVEALRKEQATREAGDMP